MNKINILNHLKAQKDTYAKEGIILVGLFGSYARDEQTKYSDIDIAYKLDYEKFSKKYLDGFSKLLRLDEIKNELKTILDNKKIDLIPDTNKSIMKDILYV